MNKATGEILASSSSSRSVPGLTEFEQVGFGSSYNLVETATIEACKETCLDTHSQFLGKLSKTKIDNAIKILLTQ
jgi:hypothetical protein